VHTVFRKFRDRLTNPLRKVVAFSMCFDTLTCIPYFLLVVVRVTSWAVVIISALSAWQMERHWEGDGPGFPRIPPNRFQR
jgi:hypothetical protein